MKKNYAMMFPGQGSQSRGMLADFAPSVVKVFQTASQILEYDLWQLVQEDREQQLDRTEYTQLALLVSSYSLWQEWQKAVDFTPKMLAGHSLGEYSALVAAQSLEFADAIPLVQMRGRLMQEAVSEGAMAAIVGLNDAAVLQLCQDLQAQNKMVAAANFNSPGQVVIAGTTAAIQEAMQVAKNIGAKLVKQLAVSVPAHCKLMQPAADEFAKYLENTRFNPPRIPVVRNVDANFHQHPDDIRQFLLEQLISPVRWVSCVTSIAQEGISDFVECGPGMVLSNLLKRIDPQLNPHSTATVVAMQRSVNEIIKIEELEQA